MNPETTNTEVPEQKVIKSSPSHLIIFFLVILAVAVFSALGTYYYLLPQLQNQKNNSYPLQQSDQSNTNIDNMKKDTTINQDITGNEGWKTFINNDEGISLQYPANWEVKDRIGSNDNCGNNGKVVGVTLSGSEGGIGILWAGTFPGGGSSDEETIITQGQTFTAAHFVRDDNSESWFFLANDKSISASANNKEDRDIIFKIFSTTKFSAPKVKNTGCNG